MNLQEAPALFDSFTVKYFVHGHDCGARLFTSGLLCICVVLGKRLACNFKAKENKSLYHVTFINLVYQSETEREWGGGQTRSIKHAPNNVFP